MDDLENIKRIRLREMKEKEWQGIQKDMAEGSNKSIKQQEQLSGYGAGSPWMERRSLTQEEVDYFEDKPSNKSFSSDFVEEMSTTFPDMVVLEPRKFDKAITGVVERINLHVFCYDVARILNILQEEGMSQQEAQEYFEYNILGSWMGEHTPVYLTNTNPKD